IAVLRDEGTSGLVDVSRVEAMTNLLELADPEVGTLLLSVANLEVTDKEMKGRFALIADGLEALRENTREEIKEEEHRREIHRRVWGVKRVPVDFFGLPLPPKKAEGEDKKDK